jgi:5'-3' exonuclease
VPGVKVHLVDGTYELFRAYYGVPSFVAPDGREVGAVRGLIQSLLVLLRQDDVTHVGCAFDHVIESFRNRLFEGYKTGEGVPEALLGQFNLAERAVSALGLVVWSMTEFEADDAIATAAARWEDAPEVEQIVICSPDKDLAQMVNGNKVVTLDRRRNVVLDEAGVREKFGVPPKSIPDYLALVGDSADGIPGIHRWGAKTAAQILERYQRLENIPLNSAEWAVSVRGAKGAADSLAQHLEQVLLYRKLATLRRDVPLIQTLGDLEWRGARRAEFHSLCDELGFGRLKELPHQWSEEG